MKRAGPSITVGELFDLYTRFHVRTKTKCPQNSSNAFKNHIGYWKDIPVATITRADIQRWYDELAYEFSGYTAHAAHGYMSAAINWSIKRGYFEGVNPCKGIDKIRWQSRDRFMKPVEVEMFLSSLSYEPDPVRDLFLILLATAARKTNVLEMRWEDIDLDLGLWRIPDPKNKTPYVVPLTPDALAVLHRRKRSTRTKWVFPGSGKTGHIVDISTAFKRITQRSGITNLRIHDLRRTMASYMAIDGSSPYIIGAMLGHRDPRSTAVYARLDINPVRKAAEVVHKKWKLVSEQERQKYQISATDDGGEYRKPPLSPKKQETPKVCDVEQLLRIHRIEGAILRVLSKTERACKKTFYRSISSRWGVRYPELNQVLSAMIDKGYLATTWETKGQRHTCYFSLASSVELFCNAKETDDTPFEKPLGDTDTPTKPTPTKNTVRPDYEWDDIVPGLGLRHFKNVSVWMVKYRLNGKQIMTTIAPEHGLSREDARTIALSMIGKKSRRWVYVWDQLVPELGLKRGKSSSSWVLRRYHNVKGRITEVILGREANLSLEEARSIALSKMESTLEVRRHESE